MAIECTHETALVMKTAQPSLQINLYNAMQISYTFLWGTFSLVILVQHCILLLLTVNYTVLV